MGRYKDQIQIQNQETTKIRNTGGIYKLFIKSIYPFERGYLAAHLARAAWEEEG